MLQSLLVVMIALNLAVSSVPRCGMLRHVVSALSSQDLPQASCHSHDDQEEGNKEFADQAEISGDQFCPCELSRFSYIWVIFDLRAKLSGWLVSEPMVAGWSTLLAFSDWRAEPQPPPPRYLHS